MKKWLLWACTALSVIAVLLTGVWYVWREYYSADQFAKAWEEQPANVSAPHQGPRYEVMERILLWGGKVPDDFKGVTLLHIAVARQNTKRVKELLAMRYDVNQKAGTHGPCPINIASSNNSHDVMKILLDANADVNIQNEYFESLLFSKIPNSMTDFPEEELKAVEETIEILIQHGAAVYVYSKKDPFGKALYTAHYGIIRMFLEAGADKQLKENYFYDALEIVLSDSNKILSPEELNLAKLLIRHGANPYTKMPKNIKSPIEVWPELSRAIKELQDEGVAIPKRGVLAPTKESDNRYKKNDFWHLEL